MGGGGVGGSDVSVWVFLKGRALIHSSKWEGHDFFRKKIIKYPGPNPPSFLCESSGNNFCVCKVA